MSCRVCRRGLVRPLALHNARQAAGELLYSCFDLFLISI